MHDLSYHNYGNMPELNSEAGDFWRARKLKSDRGEEELLKLSANVIDSSGESSSSRILAITADATEAMNENDSADLIISSHSEDNTIRTMLHVRTPPGNESVATGSADLIVKIWDLASRKLRLSLLRHVSAVRCCKISRRQPFLFMDGEDKQYNKVIHHYQGYLSSVQDLTIHPTIEVLITCARDSIARVRDIRTVAQVHCLSGHTNTVATITPQEVLTANHDSTIQLWDLVAGQSICTLLHHKKSV
uniref:WD_REPEATS_REGION domain-containing protein n=1 Tax=Onchocerca volvulus TaxID=6282 RepID=A0A8R1TUN9_ONCVO